MIVRRDMIIPQVPHLLVSQEKTKRQVQLKRCHSNGSPSSLVEDHANESCTNTEDGCCDESVRICAHFCWWMGRGLRSSSGRDVYCRGSPIVRQLGGSFTGAAAAAAPPPLCLGATRCFAVW